MHALVDEIIAPYFAAQKAKLGLPDSQKSTWQIDVWSVHSRLVPGGCTGVWQACDVGIQRIFKHSLKCSYCDSESVLETAVIRQYAPSQLQYPKPRT